MPTMTLEEAASIISARDQEGQPIPCELQYITLDMKRNKGGERVIVKRAGVFTSRLKSTAYAASVEKPSRDPQNWRNTTRNMIDLDTGKPHKPHLILIEKVNGISVAL